MVTLQVLEHIMGLLDSSLGNLVLPECGPGTVQRHPSFQLFAAMNPATDSGKKHLPLQIRSHFTEIYVAEPTEHEDLVCLHYALIAVLLHECAKVPHSRSDAEFSFNTTHIFGGNSMFYHSMSIIKAFVKSPLSSPLPRASRM